VLIARSFDFNEWGESLEGGAFDVLDALQELPKAAEVASQAFSAARSKSPKAFKIEQSGASRSEKLSAS